MMWLRTIKSQRKKNLVIFSMHLSYSYSLGGQSYLNFQKIQETMKEL